MCTSIISNRNKTIVGWNLDLLDMEYRVRPNEKGVFIEILDEKEGWMPLFGANRRGGFVGMPTCWPYDKRSDPKSGNETNLIVLNMDYLLMKKTLEETKRIAEEGRICSIPELTFMSTLSDKDGDLLQIVPGQGTRYFEKPKYMVLTNFSPFKMDAEKHPWMGWDRYQTAVKMLENASDNFDVKDAFSVLRAVSQEVCPTVVSMVYDATEEKVYWCENREWDRVSHFSFTTISPDV